MPYFASLVRSTGKVTGFRPVLPAGTQVVFRMRVTVPDQPGRQKVLWTLDGPQEMPGFYGVVDVTPPLSDRRGRGQRGPTTARISGWVNSSRRERAYVVEGDGVDPGEHLVDAEQLVVDQLGLAEAGHPRAGVLEAEHQPAA